MKRENGITLISLVVTIIVLIILAGVSINLVLGQDGIITKARLAKQNMELTQIEEQEQLNELYEQMITGSSGISYDYIAKLTEFKKAIADYIDEAGGVKPEYTADTETFGESIKGIVKEVTKNATATENDIAEGKTAWVNGNKIIGTAKNTDNLTQVKTLIGSPDWQQLYNDKNKGWVQYHNTATSYAEPIDVTEYKYLVLEYNRYNYYNQTIGIGLYDSSSPTYLQCLNAEVRVTESSTGTSSNTFTPRLIYIDISAIEGNKYPFVYVTSDMYEHILHFYLTKSSEIPTL